jgi:hypothetical protein
MSTYYGVEESIYITNSQNVGIGITNPTKKLEVVGDIDTTTDYNISGVQVLSSTTLGSAVVNASLTSNTGDLTNTGNLAITGNLSIANTKDIKINSVTVLDSTTLGSGIVNSSLTSVGTLSSLDLSGDITGVGAITASGNLSASATTIDSLIVDTTTLVVDATNNRVGLGTATPSTLLDLNLSSATTPALLIRNGNANVAINDGAQIEFGFQGNADYSHYIHTRHNNVGANNAIDFYVCDGLISNTLTSGSTHTMSLNAGNVGIGITDPSYELDVAGDINLTGDLRINGVAQAFGGGSSVWSTNSTVAYYNDGNVGIGTNAPEGGMILDVRGNMRLGNGTSAEQDIKYVSANGNWQVGTNDTGNGTSGNQFFIYETDNDYLFTVQKGTGDVGIGTKTPTGKLHIRGSVTNTTAYSTTSPLLRLTQTNAADPYDFVGMVIETGGYSHTIGMSLNTLQLKARGDTIYGDMEFIVGAGTTTAMYINYLGNVGIGNNSPATKMEIEDVSPMLRLTDSRSSISGSGVELGGIEFYSRDASTDNDYDPVAKLQIVSSNTTVAPDGTFVFLNGINGVLSESMRITNLGDVEVTGKISSVNRMVHYRDEKTSGSHGGQRVGAGFNTRTLNTRYGDTTFTTFTNNLITFTESGTYRIKARAPGYRVYRHMILIKKTDDANGNSADLMFGSGSFSNTYTPSFQTDSFVDSVFTMTTGDVIALQHYLQSGSGTHDLGVNVSPPAPGIEVYGEMWITKLS